MTYKNAVAGLNLGGGKAVIIGDNQMRDREMIFRAHGRFVESLGGRYITAEDVGTSHRRHGLRAHGHGVRRGPWQQVRRSVAGHGARACSAPSWRRRSGAGGARRSRARRSSCRARGNVGRYLCAELAAVGAKLKVYDIRPERVEAVVKAHGAKAVGADEVYTTKADIFAPCALGAILNDDTIPQLQVEIVAGGANNQLAVADRHGAALEKRNILYAPDFVANAGGVINVYSELVGWTHERALRKADEIYDTMLGVYEIAKDEKITTSLAADRLGERRLAQVGGLVKSWPQWPHKT